MQESLRLGVVVAASCKEMQGWNAEQREESPGQQGKQDEQHHPLRSPGDVADRDSCPHGLHGTRCVEPRALPVLRGALAYCGWYQHAALGRKYARLVVFNINDQWCGEFDYSDKELGSRRRVAISVRSVRSVKIAYASTELRANVARNGTLTGEVIHDGVAGGNFKLFALEGRQIEELRGERCMEVPVPVSVADLPSECSICLARFSVGQLVSRTNCSKSGHIFHTSCVQEWLTSHTSCPMCRQTLLPNGADEAVQKAPYLATLGLTQL